MVGQSPPSPPASVASGAARITTRPFLDEFEVEWAASPLGVGATGAVRRCVCRETGREYAVKMVRDNADGRREVKTHLMATPHEHIVMLHRVHENHVHLPGDSCARDWLILVMELMR